MADNLIAENIHILVNPLEETSESAKKQAKTVQNHFKNYLAYVLEKTGQSFNETTLEGLAVHNKASLTEDLIGKFIDYLHKEQQSDENECRHTEGNTDKECFLMKELQRFAETERLHCLQIANQLFHPLQEINLIRQEWIRFFPVFVKTQLFEIEKETIPTSPEKEVEFPHGHARFNVFGPMGPLCRTPMEKYGMGDDEKRVCGLQQLQHLSLVERERGIHHHECIILSIGCNNQWGFEEAIIKTTNCRVETIDCTVSAEVEPPEHIRHRVRLHRVCLSDQDYQINNYQFISWQSLNQLLDLQTAPTLLKMDIEGYEFPVLRSIIDSGKLLPLQIAIEFHSIRVEFIKRATTGKVDEYRVNSLELYSFMQYLFAFGGYYLIDRRDNPYCPHCTEVLLAKLHCENYPKPQNFKEILLNGDHQLFHPLYKEALEKSLDARYYY